MEVLRRGSRGMDAERGLKGRGRRGRDAPSDRPPERHRSEGSPGAKRPDPDVGVGFLLLTFLCPHKEK